MTISNIFFQETHGKVKNKKSYIEFLNKYFRQTDSAFDVSDFDRREYDEDYIKEIDEHITSVTDNIAINSIGNLVLLYKKLNQSISNSNFAIKKYGELLITIVRDHSFNRILL